MSHAWTPNSGSPRHDRVVTELYQRWPEHRIAPSLGRIQALCDLLGSPEKAAPVIQITGTNGKGSTAIMIDAILRASGLRTGRYTSPHLVDVTERICIDGEPISQDRFDDIYDQIAPMVEMVDAQLIDGVRLTAFELYTALAYAAFADAPVDVAVVEVGMGGTWDATNVADAQVAVVLPVDLDHMHILGDTIAEIAHEKAGIIKADSVAVLAAQKPEAARVLMQRCQEVGARPVLEGMHFSVVSRSQAVGGQVLQLDELTGPLDAVHLPLFGAHMAENAAVAIAAVESFVGGHELSEQVIDAGLAGVVAPARLEVVRRSPSVVLDTAHNPHGVRATVDAVEEAFAFTPLIGVVSMMRDKNVEEVLRILSEAMSDVVVTRVQSTERGLPVDELADLASGVFGADHVTSAESYREALDIAMAQADEAGPSAGVLVVGSVIGAGEARAILVPPGGPRTSPAAGESDGLITVEVGDPADPEPLE